MLFTFLKREKKNKEQVSTSVKKHAAFRVKFDVI